MTKGLGLQESFPAPQFCGVVFWWTLLSTVTGNFSGEMLKLVKFRTKHSDDM